MWRDNHSAFAARIFFTQRRVDYVFDVGTLSPLPTEKAKPVPKNGYVIDTIKPSYADGAEVEAVPLRYENVGRRLACLKARALFSAVRPAYLER